MDHRKEPKVAGADEALFLKLRDRRQAFETLWRASERPARRSCLPVADGRCYLADFDSSRSARLMASLLRRIASRLSATMTHVVRMLFLVVAHSSAEFEIALAIGSVWEIGISMMRLRHYWF